MTQCNISNKCKNINDPVPNSPLQRVGVAYTFLHLLILRVFWIFVAVVVFLKMISWLCQQNVLNIRVDQGLANFWTVEFYVKSQLDESMVFLFEVLLNIWRAKSCHIDNKDPHALHFADRWDIQMIRITSKGLILLVSHILAWTIKPKYLLQT